MAPTKITVNPILPQTKTVATRGPQSFVQRLLKFSIQLAQNTQSNQPATFTNGQNAVTIEGLRASVQVTNSGAPANNSAVVRVWGLSQNLMNQLTTLGMVYQQIKRNTLTILAGDNTSGFTAIFTGTIAQAYADYSNQPDVPFIFECQTGLADNVAPAVASSFTGPTAVADIAAGLARQMNRGFVNNGVTGQLRNPYYSGNLDSQLQRLARDAPFDWTYENGTTLVIWPKGRNRTGGDIPLISKTSQMIVSPTFTAQGIIVRTIFQPKLSRGQLFKVETAVALGTAQWTVQKIDHALDSMIYNGRWESTLYGYNPQYQTPVPPKA